MRKTVPNWVFAPPRPASIFIPYRVGLTGSKTLAIRSTEPIESTGVARCIFIPKDSSQETQENIDVLFAYLTSSIFLLDYIKKSRVAAGAFRRLYSTDLKTLMKFPNISQLSEEHKKLILEASNEHNKKIPLKNCPSFDEAISQVRDNKNNSLRKLDEEWFKALNIPLNTLDALYEEILKELSRY